MTRNHARRTPIVIHGHQGQLAGVEPTSKHVKLLFFTFELWPRPPRTLNLGYVQPPMPRVVRTTRCPNYHKCGMTSDMCNIIEHVSQENRHNCKAVWLEEVRAANQAVQDKVNSMISSRNRAKSMILLALFTKNLDPGYESSSTVCRSHFSTPIAQLQSCVSGAPHYRQPGSQARQDRITSA